MSARVTLFSRKQFQPFGYYFYVVAWNDFENKTEKALNQFGERLGFDGIVVQAHEGKRYDTAEEILKLPWPEELLKSMRRSPASFLLVLQKEIPDFDLHQDHWAVIWLEDSIDDLRDILHQIALSVREKGDVFKLLEDAYSKQKKEAIKEAAKALVPTLKWGAGIAISAAKLFI